MALTQGNLITSEDINALKAKVKTEMGKRAYGNGPLNSFSTDFSVSAGVGDLIRTTHFDETIGYIEKINTTGLNGTAGSLIEALNVADAQLDVYMTRDRYDTVSDCAANCTGYCSTACIGGCRGTCTANCANNCSGGCRGGCTGCSGSCSGSCSGCSGSCSGGCQGCGDGCTSLCTSCYTTCYGGCQGCDFTCTGSCRTGCWHEYY